MVFNSKKAIMRKPLAFFLSILVLLTSCGTVNQPKFKNNNNHKELILSKYGESTIIKNDDNYETWVYDYGSFLKSNRNVIFNKENRRDLCFGGEDSRAWAISEEDILLSSLLISFNERLEDSSKIIFRFS